ncbi:hypothetical protein F8B43_4393 [Methylorubrum populi]|uniref:Uncharacterized protein n=1 Tax=Methylorubrum populi TaxID=223967 RepID=A0A833J2V3_9HYPH|nr:hypothetical protein F8B43_4393 [Methylorubrum populi]
MCLLPSNMRVGRTRRRQRQDGETLQRERKRLAILPWRPLPSSRPVRTGRAPCPDNPSWCAVLSWRRTGLHFG